MKTKQEIWMQRWRVWVPALIFFLLNVTALAAYKLGSFGDNANLQQERLEARLQEEERLQKERAALEAKVEAVIENRNQVVNLYSNRFASQSERLTRIISEVRQLAKQAGMRPSRVSYPESPLQDFGLVQKSFIFSVTGSYADLRKFINSLELTESFLTLEKVSLSQADASGILNINLQLSTLFLDDPLDEDLVAQARSATSPQESEVEENGEDEEPAGDEPPVEELDT